MQDPASESWKAEDQGKQKSEKPDRKNTTSCVIFHRLLEKVQLDDGKQEPWWGLDCRGSGRELVP